MGRNEMVCQIFQFTELHPNDQKYVSSESVRTVMELPGAGNSGTDDQSAQIQTV